ncbi:MAG TPA: ERAP1-like C-terminal domain-containing protein [Myxococcales bacterium]|jgi:alanyl aminopeptidase|nr:ERAP1-like C-terminal domain-containing protein [Myxococcales bacterium]
MPPYPKLDSVMLPDATYALENAGEIHYAEDIFLNKEGVTSDQRRILIATVIAHEQAHQWFGDLVMMPWWDDAWLNESFATWMATQMIQEWKPQWNAGLDLQRSAVAAMKADALPGARAIRQTLTSVKQIPAQFDELTYQKGGAVLTMFEHYLGAVKFRRGISAYIDGHARGTGSTDDLLAALSPEVIAPFHSFLDQAGVPLVQASLHCPSITLKQSRFLPLGSTVANDRLWQIPVCLRLGKGGESRVQCAILSKAEESIPLPECPDWVMPNADAAGYYRWSMPGAELQKLRAAKLSTPERISSAQSLNAAVSSGALPAAEALGLLEPIVRDPDGEVAAEAMALLRQTRDHFLPAEDAPRLNAYASQLFAPVLARLGYSAKAGESTSTRRLRAAVLELLAWAEDPEVVRNLTRLGRAYAESFKPEAVDPDLARLALSTAVEHGDDAFFDGLQQRLAAVTDGELRVRIIAALASSPRGLALSLDPRLRQQETSVPLFIQGADSRTRDAVWAFTRAHYDELVARLPELGGVTFLPQAMEGYCDAAKAAEVEAFFGPRAAKHPGMEQTLRQTVESIRLCAAQSAAQSPSARSFFATAKH